MAQDGDLDSSLYKDNFDPAHSQQGDLELAGLGNSVDQHEEKLRKFKARIEDWRAVAVPIVQFVEWTPAWSPAVLVGLNTVFFLLIWYLDLSVLSTLAVLGTFIAFADGIVPILSTTIFDTSAWTVSQEHEYDVLCNRLMSVSHCASGFCTYLHGVKAQLPRVFSLGLCGVFILLAIIFDRVNNFFLVYFITTLILLAPGLHAKGVLALGQKHAQELVHKIRNRKSGKQH